MNHKILFFREHDITHEKKTKRVEGKLNEL